MIKRTFEVCGITSSDLDKVSLLIDAFLKDIMKKIDINDNMEDDDVDP